MIGVVKIKDGLFICDEFGAQVSLIITLGPRVRCRKQSYPRRQYRRNIATQFLGSHWCTLLNSKLARRRKANAFWRSRKNPRRNFQIHWGGNLKPRKCAHLKYQGVKPLVFCDRNIHNAQVPLEHYENTRIFEFAQAWSWNEAKLFALAAVIWRKADCPRIGTQVSAMERVVWHSYVSLRERRGDPTKHLLKFLVRPDVAPRANHSSKKAG